MKRRKFIALVGGVAAWPLSVLGQSPDRLRRIGVLVAPAENDPETHRRLAVFRQKLDELGWVEGRNLRSDYRWAGGNPNKMQQFAKELIALQPDVIVAATSQPAVLLRQETHTIPLVFLFVSDPVGAGLVESMGRPGGNVTGFTDVEGSLSGKWVELLKEIAPDVRRVAFVFNPETMSGRGSYFLLPFEAAAPKLAIEPIATALLPRSNKRWQHMRAKQAAAS